MAMLIPTTESISDDLERQFDQVNKALIACRRLAVYWKSQCAAGDISIHELLHGLYVPFVQEAPFGIWNTVKLLNSPALRNFYADKLGKRIQVIDVRGSVDDLNCEGHNFDVDDKVRFRGPGSPPDEYDKVTNYYVVNVNGDFVQLSATEGGTAIDHGIGGWEGTIYLQMEWSDEQSALKDAIEAVIDQIILDVPVGGSNDIEHLRFNKYLAQSSTGLREMTLTSVETADIQTKLQDVIDLIEAPI
jgi:hypothetical protein